MPIGVADDLCTKAERAENDKDIFDIGHGLISCVGAIAASGCRRDYKSGGLPGDAVFGGDPARLRLVA
jgi:hypothetical protein